MDKQVVTLIDSDGVKKDVDIVSILPSKRDSKIYLAYSDGTSDEAEMVDLYFAILTEDQDGLRIHAIESDEEFTYVESLLEEEIKEI